MSVRQFRSQLPAFRATPTAVIESGLADALLQINVPLWGDKANAGQKYLAADIIASGPLGEKARLKKDSNVTVYRIIYESLKMQVTVGVGRNT